MAFARAAAVGSLAGALAEAAFCLAYGRFAFRGQWALALVLGTTAFAATGVLLQSVPLHLVMLCALGSSCLAFAAAALALQHLPLGIAWLLPAVVAALALAFRLIPGGAPRGVAAPPPRWDIPVRMAVTTGLVLLLTGAAPALGPRLAGLLATFPLYAAILTVFAHRQEGPGPAVQVLGGLLLGLFSFAGFFAVLAALLDRAGMVLGFTAAVGAALVLQACSLALVPGRR